MLLKRVNCVAINTLLTHCADNEFQLSTTLLLKTNFLVCKRNFFLNSFFSWPLLNVNSARLRLKTATLGLRTTAAGREFQMLTMRLEKKLMSRIDTALFLIQFHSVTSSSR